jgi:hypothetical protein
VKVVDNYGGAVGKMPRGESRTDSFDTETGKWPTSFQQASGAGWHVTAIATVEEDVPSKHPVRSSRASRSQRARM